MTSGDRSSPKGGTHELDEVLARLLDRGIVIEAAFRFGVAGLELAGMEAHIVVAGIDTYLTYASAVGGALDPPEPSGPLPPPAEIPAEADTPGTRNRLRPFWDGDDTPGRPW